jgi:transcriptional regulator with XRE-family HTH domain
MDLAERLGIRIRYLRQIRGMTQDQLAASAKITRPYISQIEGGKFDVRLDTIAAICHGLHIHPSELFAEVRFEGDP